MAGGEEAPAVATALGYVEGFALAKQVQHRQIVDSALGAARKAETKNGGRGGLQIPVLHADEFTFLIIIRYLEPGDALPVFPRSEAAPADDTGIEPSLLKEEMASFVVQERMLKVPLIARGIEGRRRSTLIIRNILNTRNTRNTQSGVVGKPSARFSEVFAEHLLRQTDCVAFFSAGPAFISVAPEGEAWVLVLVKGAEAFVAADSQSESLCDPLNGEVAELLKFYSIHFEF